MPEPGRRESALLVDETELTCEEGPTVCCALCGEAACRASFGSRDWVHVEEVIYLPGVTSNFDHKPQVPAAIQNIIEISEVKSCTLPGN